MYKFKRWQWALIISGLLMYFTIITFQVYGNFYLGYPPYTPAFLSHSKRPIERIFELQRPSSLRVWGTLKEGRITLKINGTIKREWVDDFNLRLTLPAGTQKMRIEFEEATGQLEYSLE
ncbi:MAG: hypothetical protein RLZZ156_454 [Deinococcota bacterium]|jgi:hypothetical protein